MSDSSLTDDGRRLGEPTLADRTFDGLLPARLRLASRAYWTPARVAREAAAVFAAANVRRVLDVGSGVGKFCLVGAANEPTIAFYGAEHRSGLVDVAKHVQSRLGVTNVAYYTDDATCLPWASFEGIYLYNPFMENVFVHKPFVSGPVGLSGIGCVEVVRRAEQLLETAPLGTHLITYYRFGGRVPGCYELVKARLIKDACWLRLWIKRRESSIGYYLEPEDAACIACDGALDENPIPAIIRMLAPEALR